MTTATEKLLVLSESAALRVFRDHLILRRAHGLLTDAAALEDFADEARRMAWEIERNNQCPHP